MAWYPRPRRGEPREPASQAAKQVDAKHEKWAEIIASVSTPEPHSHPHPLCLPANISQQHIHHVLEAVHRVRWGLPRPRALHASHRRRGDSRITYHSYSHKHAFSGTMQGSSSVTCAPMWIDCFRVISSSSLQFRSSAPNDFVLFEAIGGGKSVWVSGDKIVLHRKYISYVIVGSASWRRLKNEDKHTNSSLRCIGCSFAWEDSTLGN